MNLFARALAACAARGRPGGGSLRPPPSRLTIRGAGFGHGVGDVAVRRNGHGDAGVGSRPHPRALLYRHRAGRAERGAGGARVVAVRPRAASFTGANAAAGRILDPAKTYTVRARAGGLVGADRPRGSASSRSWRRRCASPDRRHVVLRGRAANGPGRRRLPRRARVPARLARRHQLDQRGAARGVRAGRRAGRVALDLAARGAQGAGRRRAHLRGHHRQGRRRVGARTRTRARRSTAGSPWRPRRRTRPPRRPAAGS